MGEVKSVSTAAPEKIRIAYVLPSEVRGGVEEHVLSLLKSINKDIFEVFLVVSARLAESLAGDLAPDDARIIRLRIGSLTDFSAMKSFFKFLCKQKIHIVNTHMFVATFYYAPIAWLAGVPVLLETTHLIEKWRLDKGFFKRHSFVVDKLFSLGINRILAVSHACKRDLVALKRISDGKIVVVQNGRDLNNFNSVNISSRQELRTRFGYEADDLVFGVFARLNHQKGHKYLLDALGILKQRGIKAKIILVGDGELRQQLVSQAESLGVTDQIAFAGFMKDMPAMLNMTDITILPSLYEGLPLCAIEALAMERPVIATAVDGTPEVIRDHENGLLVPPKDPHALAEAIEFAMNHTDEMRAMGKRGRAFVVQNFSLRRQVRETERLYLDLCRECGISLPYLSCKV